MKRLVPSVVPIVAGFLLGSIPVGVLVGRACGVNIRARGSGNIGATNALRVMGPKAGLLVLLADMAKGVLPVLLARHAVEPQTAMWAALAGLAAVIGHCFSPFLRFSGGKGVATAFGALLAIDWRVGLIAVVFFAVLLAIWRYVSLGSIVAAGLLWIIALALHREPTVVIVFAAIGGIVIQRHSGNIRRLLSGTENKLGRNKRDGAAPASDDGEASG